MGQRVSWMEGCWDTRSFGEIIGYAQTEDGGAQCVVRAEEDDRVALRYTLDLRPEAPVDLERRGPTLSQDEPEDIDERPDLEF